MAILRGGAASHGGSFQREIFPIKIGCCPNSEPIVLIRHRRPVEKGAPRPDRRRQSQRRRLGQAVGVAPRNLPGAALPKLNKGCRTGHPFVSRRKTRPSRSSTARPRRSPNPSSWTLVEAQRVKEIYLALLRKQEFQVERRELVEIEESTLGQIGGQLF